MPIKEGDCNFVLCFLKYTDFRGFYYLCCMTFRGKEIPNPTLKMVAFFVKKKGLKIVPRDLLIYMRECKWQNAQGEPYATLEGAILGYNAIKNVINKNPIKKEKIPYQEQLKDRRWLAFREKVLKMKGNKCEQCGSIDGLQVHHKRYIYGKYAWEYKTKDVMVLCAECHKRKHSLEIERKEMIRLMDRKSGHSTE